MALSVQQTRDVGVMSDTLRCFYRPQTRLPSPVAAAQRTVIVPRFCDGSKPDLAHVLRRTRSGLWCNVEGGAERRARQFESLQLPSHAHGFPIASIVHSGGSFYHSSWPSLSRSETYGLVRYNTDVARRFMTVAGSQVSKVRRMSPTAFPESTTPLRCA